MEKIHAETPKSHRTRGKNQGRKRGYRTVGTRATKGAAKKAACRGTKARDKGVA